MPSPALTPKLQHVIHGLRLAITPAILIALSATANAALIETTASAFDADCCQSFFYNTRIGDNLLGPDSDNVAGPTWEVRSEQNPADTFYQRTYTSGISESFTLTSNAALGLVTYTLGGDTYQMDFGNNIGWETIGLEIRVRDNKSKGLRRVTLDNLSFQSAGIGIDVDTALTNNNLLVSNQGGSDSRQSALFLQDDLDPYLGDFTLSGTMTFEWQDSDDGAFEDPTTGDLRFRVGVAGQVTNVPVPASIWLFGSALAGLGWFRRRQTA